jgi:hypothetical protein
MSESASTAAQIVNMCSSGFQGILNGKYDLLIIDVHAKTELYLSVYKTVTCGLKLYHVMVFCINRVCCTHYAVISTLCIFR